MKFYSEIKIIYSVVSQKYYNEQKQARNKWMHKNTYMIPLTMRQKDERKGGGQIGLPFPKTCTLLYIWQQQRKPEHIT